MVSDVLASFIEARPSKEAVANIICDQKNVSSVLCSRKQVLERKFKESKLAKLLDNQRNIEELENTGIISNPVIASSLHSTQRKLEKQLARSNVYYGLKNRSTREDLQNRRILEKEDSVDHQKHRLFHLSYILLHFISSLSQQGALTWNEKFFFKDMVIEEDPRILAIAEDPSDHDYEPKKFRLALLSLLHQ